LPGQLCFNRVDEILFVGDGSNFKTDFKGIQQPAPDGGGWFSLPLSYESLGDFYLLNPEEYSPAPSNGMVLAYSAALGKPYWENPSSLGAPTVYTTTNAAVAAAPGATVSEKISNAIGATPVEADSAIVTGLPGQVYQGLYLYKSGNWVFAAGYADPTATEVVYDNAISGLIASTVQEAIDALAAGKIDIASNAPLNGLILSWNAGSPVWISPDSIYPTANQVSFDPTGTGLPPFADTVQEALTLTWGLADDAKTEADSAQNTANAAFVSANNALTVANAALPKAGGTMTGDINFVSGQPVDAGSF
jgi:hypothetical protein